MNKWYVIRTKIRQEQIAFENLQRQGYQCFYPRLKKIQRKRGTKQECIEALFPGYLFIHLDIEKTNVRPIRSTRGVYGLVVFGLQVKPVSDGIISTLQFQVNDEGVIENKEIEFTTGQKVRIQSGAMEGLEAIFQVKNGRDRAMLLLNILGTDRLVEIPVADLQGC